MDCSKVRCLMDLPYEFHFEIGQISPAICQSLIESCPIEIEPFQFEFGICQRKPIKYKLMFRYLLLLSNMVLVSFYWDSFSNTNFIKLHIRST